MGYSHYFRREKEIPKEAFSSIVSDFKKLLPKISELGISLAGGNGDGEPQVTEEGIIFNGNQHCGHLKNAEICIPWPSEHAKGIAGFTEDVESGHWFAGVTIDKRVCNGDCSYETFHFPRVMELEGWDRAEEGKYFQFCKTAFRPYDLAVIAALIVVKHYLKDKITVSSDGEIEHWMDGMLLCEQILGFGMGFALDK